MSDLEKRARTITGAIAKNNLASRFQHGNESPLDMMKRIQSEITSDEIANLWQNKLESMGVVFSHDEFPEGHFTIDTNGCVFAFQKLSVTWQSRRKLCLKTLLLMDFKKRHYR